MHTWNYHSIQLHGIITYKEATLQLNRDPITVIRGRNRDAHDNPNGAGKSLPFGALNNLQYFQPPMAVKKNSANEYHQDGSFIRVTGDDGEDEYQIDQYGKKSGVGYRIFRNGKDLKIREVKTAREKIQELMPWNHSQFTSEVYLNSRMPNVLLMGTGAQRHEFFENLFDMHSFDQIYKYVRDRYTVTKEAKATYQTLKNDVIEKIDGDPAVLKGRIKKLNRFIERLTKRMTAYRRDLHNAEMYLNLANDLQTESTLEELTASHKKVITRIKTLEIQVETNREIEAAWSEYRNYRKQVARFGEQLEAIPNTKVNVAKLEKKAKKLLHKISNVSVQLDKKKSLKELAAKQMEGDKLGIAGYIKVKQDGFLPKWAKDYTAVLDRAPELKAYADSRVEAMTERVRGLKESKGTCLVCGSELSDKNHKKLHAQSTEELEWLLRCEKFFSFMVKQHDLTKKVKEATMDMVKEFFDENLADLNKRVDTYRKQIDNQKKRRLILDQLQGIEKVSKPEQELVEIDTDRLDKLRKLKEHNANQIFILEKLAKLKTPYHDKNEAEANRAVLQKAIDQAQEKLETYQDSLRRASDTYAQIREQRRQQKKVQQLLDEKRKQVRMFPIYDALVAAYGPRGLRVDAIRNIAEQYAENLTMHSRSIFPEPISFSARIENREFGIMFERNGRKSDVRHLSGAESRAFANLNILALLPLLPAHLRTNILILDEMESNLSKQSRELYAGEFIPQISKIVPHVFVVTPFTQEELYIPNARTIMAIKHKGVSRLEVK